MEWREFFPDPFRALWIADELSPYNGVGLSSDINGNLFEFRVEISSSLNFDALIGTFWTRFMLTCSALFITGSNVLLYNSIKYIDSAAAADIM